MLFSSYTLEHPQTFNLNIYAMTLLKFNRQNGLFPWGNDAFKNLLSFDPFVNDDFTFDNGILPAMNIQEKDDLFEIEFAVPGFSKEDFNITLDENILHVSGEKTQEEEETTENYKRKEFSFNSFKRSLKLPASADLEVNVNATYKKGILQLQLAKKEAVKTSPEKQIKIS